MQNNGYKFLQSKIRDSNCEDISETISYIKHYGCGIYGGPAIKKGCPEVLDGDYWIIFNPETLVPKELALIGH